MVFKFEIVLKQSFNIVDEVLVGTSKNNIIHINENNYESGISSFCVKWPVIFGLNKTMKSKDGTKFVKSASRGLFKSINRLVKFTN